MTDDPQLRLGNADEPLGSSSSRSEEVEAMGVSVEPPFLSLSSNTDELNATAVELIITIRL